jgi:glycosyltransferase involved in cell wall biosynthesis
MSEKKIVIIFLGDFFFDARSINMVRSLLLENYSITMICTYKNKIDYEEFKNVAFHNIVLRRGGIFRYIEFHNKVVEFLKKKFFNTIIAGDFYSLSSACVYKNTNIIYDCREIYTELAVHYYNPLYKQISCWYEKYFLKYVNTIITTAKTDEKLLKQKYPNLKHLHWGQIYNYPINYSRNRKLNLKKKLNIPISYTTIVYQGVIQKNRGIGQLIKLIKSSNDIVAIIIGSGEAKNHYINKTKELNVFDRVKFINKVPYLKLLDYTAECDVGWLVIKGRGISNQFAMPNKLFEYTLMGLPVISSPLQNIKEIIQKHDLGIIVDENSLSDQLNAVKYIKTNRIQYNHIRASIKKGFTWDIQHKKFINLINEK